MRTVFRSPTLTDAVLARDLLAESGIEVQLIEGQSPYPSAENSEVWVTNEKDEDRAIHLVRTLFAKQVDERESWYCTECKENNPSAFELCWSCGAAHPVAR